MRKIVVGLHVSLDGVADGPGPADPFEKAGWFMPYFVPEIGQYIAEASAGADGLLLGRVTYDSFRSFFEGQGDSNPSAAMMNGVQKYVVSNTLKEAGWVNSKLISGDIIEQVTQLRAQDGKPIHISGSIQLIHSLLPHGLIDELDLLVAPVVVGLGRRLFPGGFGAGLKLLESRPFDSGVLLQRYAVENAPQS